MDSLTSILSSSILAHTLNATNTINITDCTKCVNNNNCTSKSNNTNNNDKPKGKMESHSGCLWGHSGHLEDPAWGSHSGSMSSGWTLLDGLFGLDLPGWTPLDLPGCTFLTGPFWLDSPGWTKKIHLKQLIQYSIPKKQLM